jgi:titin
VTGYDLYRGDHLVASLDGSATTYTDTGLANATAYSYSVSATNGVGEGSQSSSVSATTFDFPSAPQNIAAVSDVRAIHVSWSVPDSNGGSPITSYTLYRDGHPLASLSGTSYTDTGLGNGESHSYAVSATTAVGEGPQSASSRASTFDLPSPVNVTATSDVRAIHLSWSPPISDGGTPVTGYTVYRDGTVVATLAASTTSYTDSGLANGTSYSYSVSATNAVGEGPTNGVVGATTFDFAGAPQDLAAAPGAKIGDIQLSWDVAASDGGTPVTGYRLYRGTDPAHLTAAADVAADARRYVDRDRKLLTTYYYVLTALNAVGEGPTSNQAASKPFPWVPVTVQASVDVGGAGVRAGLTATATL